MGMGFRFCRTPGRYTQAVSESFAPILNTAGPKKNAAQRGSVLNYSIESGLEDTAACATAADTTAADTTAACATAATECAATACAATTACAGRVPGAA